MSVIIFRVPGKIKIRILLFYTRFSNYFERADGRRKYNVTWRLLANERKLEVIKLMKHWERFNTIQIGVQTKILF